MDLCLGWRLVADRKLSNAEEQWGEKESPYDLEIRKSEHQKIWSSDFQIFRYSEMLPKSQRLNLKKSYNFVSVGKRVETANMRVMFREGENEVPLIGIALTTKYFKKATLRNRAKRLVSTAIQTLYPRLRKGLNLVIMPKSQILDKKPEQLVEELKNVKDLYCSNWVLPKVFIFWYRDTGFFSFRGSLQI